LSLFFSFDYILSFFVLFFLICRSPLNSTLFPYTTLFRSRSSRTFASHMVKGTRMRIFFDADRLFALLAVPRREAGAGHESEQPIDRKSTRLNSSHRTISYAVFCLKQKSLYFGWSP